MNERDLVARHGTDDTLGWDGVAAIVILLVASVSLSNWLPPTSGAALLLRVIWWILYAGAVVAMIVRFGIALPIWLLRHQRPLCILVALALASCLWSVDPLVSLRTALSLVGTTALGVFIGYGIAPACILRVLAWAFGILILSGMAAVGFLPTPVSRTVGWRGIMSQKNTFGAAAELATLFFLVATRHRLLRPPWWAGVLAGLSFVALTQTRSRTSLATSLLGIAAFVYLSSASAPRLTSASLRRLSLALVLFVSVVPFFVRPVASALGNDNPLNGRTRLWKGVVMILGERPLTGYGYEAVWGREHATLLPHIPPTGRMSAASAHNIVLNVASELGIPAAIVFCVYLFIALVDVGKLFTSDPSAFSIVGVLFILSMIVIGFMESHLLSVHSVFWILFVAITIAVRRSLQDGRRCATPAADAS